MSAEDELRQASQQFYGALNRILKGDAGPMTAVWAQSPDVSTMHPVGGQEIGWEQIRSTWEQLARLCSGGQVTLRDPLIRVGGDLAYELGTESGEATIAGQQVSFDHRVTNIYRREAEGWKMVHHHTDTSPAMQEVLRRL